MNKLMIFDLEGTLLNSQNEITKESKIAICKCKEEGYYIAYITGRGTIKTKKFIEGLPCDAYACNNGSKIFCNDKLIENNCIVNSINATKINSLKVIANYFNVSKENIISFGDDYSDIEIFENSGISVAMGNAIQELKKIATYVTDDNNHNGISNFIMCKLKELNNNLVPDDNILEKCLPKYLEEDLAKLKEGMKNNVSYLDCLINELQGSVNSAFIDGDITEEQCDYLYKKYIRMEG